MSVTVPAQAIGNEPWALPITIVAGVNDENIYTPISSGIPYTATIAPGTYHTEDEMFVALNDAEYSPMLSTPPFELIPGGPPYYLRFQAFTAGDGSNGDTLTGNGMAVLGFTNQPVVFEGGGTYGNTFTPPLVKVEPPFLPDSTELEKSLWMHFENRYRGVNVWILSDGSVVQSDPSPENSNTNMSAVYPWNPNDPSGPYVRSIFIDAGADPQVATEHDVSHAVYPVANFYGGSSYTVDDDTVTLLAQYVNFGDGYGDCLT